MLFYPILCSFLPYFVTFTPTPQVEKTVKMPVLPVLTIFVDIFCSSPLLFSVLFVSFLFFPSLLSHLYLSFAPLLLSYSTTQNKAKQTICSALLYYLLSFRPDPSRMLIAQTIRMSRIRTKTKSQPMSNQPKKATTNKIRIIPRLYYIPSLDNIYNLPCCVQTLPLLFSVLQKTAQCFWHSVLPLRHAQKQSYIGNVYRSVATHKRGVRLKKTCLSSQKYLSLPYHQPLLVVSRKNLKAASLVSVWLFNLNAFAAA